MPDDPNAAATGDQGAAEPDSTADAPAPTGARASAESLAEAESKLVDLMSMDSFPASDPPTGW
jgi:hypothetical protein